MGDTERRIKIYRKPLSVDKAYKIVTIDRKDGRSYSRFGPTKELEKYQEEMEWRILNRLNQLEGSYPVEGPLHVRFVYGFTRQHRSKEGMRGLPYRDVSNPSKPLEDILSGLLWEDDTQIMRKVEEKRVAEDEFMIIEWRDWSPEDGC